MGFKIKWEANNLIHIKYEGEITLHDILDVNRLISRDSRYSKLKSNISDFLQVTNLSMSEKDVELLSLFYEIPSMLNPNQKLAIVSDTIEIREKVARYIDLMKNNEWRVELFYNLEKSRAWCNQK